eukprot:4858339-Amphidinium_carterae.1
MKPDASAKKQPLLVEILCRDSNAMMQARTLRNTPRGNTLRGNTNTNDESAHNRPRSLRFLSPAA